MRHLVERGKGRFNRSESIALSHIERIKKVLEENAPEDWRFTRNPVAKFLICDLETDFRIVGRTYRNVGEEIINELKATNLKKDKVKELTTKYLELIEKPDPAICHELKTIYRRDQDISELKTSYRAARKDLPQVIPLDAKRIATRPNAIIIKEGELWARQEELLSLGDRSLEYLLFEKLTPSGIDKSSIRVYTHDSQGNIRLERMEKRSATPLFLKRHDLPSHFRTASYWSLPTYVDAEYLDLKYKEEHYPTELTSDESFLIFRIELINKEVRRHLGLF